MKFTEFMKDRKVKSVNESEVLNEAVDIKTIMGRIKAYAAYDEAMGMVDGGDWANSLKAQWEEPYKMGEKTKAMTEMKGKIEAKAKEMSDREKKEMMYKKADAIQAKLDTIENQQKVIELKLKEAHAQNVEKLSELKKDIGAVPELSTTLTAKERAVTAEEGPGGIQNEEKNAASAEKWSSKDRADKAKKRLEDANKKYEDAIKKFEDAEDVNSDDIKEVDGYKDFKAEIDAVVKAGDAFGINRKALKNIKDEVDMLKSTSEGDENAYTDFLIGEADKMINEVGDLNEDNIFEEEEKGSATPGATLSAINGLPKEPEYAEDAKKALKDLESIAGKWKETKEALIDAKNALWDASKDKATATVIRVAGGKPEKQEDGSYKNTAEKPESLDKTKLGGGFGEDGKLEGLEDAKAEWEKIEPSAKGEPEGETEDAVAEFKKNNPDHKEISAEDKDAKVTKTDDEGNETEVDKYIEVKTVKDKDGKEVHFGKPNPEAEATPESEAPTKGQNVSEDKPANKIMKFSDFMASK